MGNTMRKITLTSILIFYFNSVSWACEITIGVTDIPPYSQPGQNQQWVGTDITIFDALAQQINCTVKYIDVPFGQGLKLLNDGKIDAMPQVSRITEREEHLWFIGPVRNESIALITKNTITFEVKQLTDIKQLPSFLAKQTGTFLGDEFTRLMAEDNDFANKFFLTSSTIPRIELVARERIIGFFSIKEHLEYMIKHSPQFKQMKIHPIELVNNPVFIGLSKKSVSPSLYHKINNAFATLKPPVLVPISTPVNNNY